MAIPKPWQSLVEQALQARQLAYAPYSRFKVGCALEDEKGRFFVGCNVENASYSLSQCAERVALAKMVSEGSRRVERMALVTSAKTPCFPCGACRQVIQEFGSPLIFAFTPDQQGFSEISFDKLLPYYFSQEQLVEDLS